MIPRPDYQPSAYDDDWEDAPAAGPIPKWIGGVVVPLLMIGYGVVCFVTENGVLPSRGIHMEVYGAKAMALGLASVSMGLFLHFHYFWGNLYHLSRWAVLGKIFSLSGVIVGLGYLTVRTFLG